MNWRFWRWGPDRDRQAAGADPLPVQPRPIRPRRDWSRLPPLTATIAKRPPTLAPVLRPPDVAGARPTLRVPAPLRHHRGPAGTVSGLARVRPHSGVRRSDEHPHEPDPAPPTDVRPPLPEVDLRRLPTAERTAPRPVTLTQAHDDQVGQPRVPDLPYRSTAKYDRMLAKLQARADTGLAGFSLADFDDIEESAVDLSAAMAPPPEPRAATATDAGRPHRRHTLAASRRLGLARRAHGLADAEDETRETVPEPVDIQDLFDIQDAVDDDHHATEEPGEEPAAERADGDPVTDSSTPDDGGIRPGPRRDDTTVPPFRPGLGPPLAPPRPERSTAPYEGPPARPERSTMSGPGRPDADRGREDGGGPRARTTPQSPVHRAPQRQAPEPPPGTPTAQLVPPAIGRPVTNGPVDVDTAPRRDVPRAALALVHSTPVYRAALGALPPRIDSPASTHQGDERQDDLHVVREQVPADIASTFHSQFGVDVTGIAIHRGPAVSRRAAGLAARAFTQGGEVFLPDQAGDLSGPQTRALLAHELVHATQQRVLGSELPAEDTAQGHELEAAAVATEDWFAGSRADPPSLIHRPVPASVTTSAEVAEYAARMREELTRMSDEAGARLQLAPAQDTVDVADLVRGELAANDSTAAGRDSGPPTTGQTSAPNTAVAGEPDSAIEELRDKVRAIVAAAGEYHHSPASTPDPDQVAASARMDQLAARIDEVHEQIARVGLDPARPLALDTWLDTLYGELRSRLRGELILDRERRGRLSDFR